jgi:2-keto-3-deoxy-L-rhamnonate aldolase RhmA
VALCRYPPAGSRSVGVGRAHGYGLRFGDYLARANEQTTVVVQVEHVDGVDDIESIVWVEGVDAVFIGPYDLSASLGKPGQVNDPAVLSRIARVRDACRGAGRPLGIFGMTADAVAPFQAQGFTLLAVGMDTVFLGHAAMAARAAARAARRA